MILFLFLNVYDLPTFKSIVVFNFFYECLILFLIFFQPIKRTKYKYTVITQYVHQK